MTRRQPLSHAPLVAIALAVATVAVVAVFLRNWTRSWDRPWFPLLALLAGVTGAIVVRRLARMWRDVELVAGPLPTLRVRGLVRRSLDIPLDDVTAIRMLRRTVRARRPVLGRRLHVEHGRSDLVIERRSQAVVISATRGVVRDDLEDFGSSIEASTGVPRSTTEFDTVHERQVGAPFVDAQWLNPDVHHQGWPGGAIGVSALTVLGMFLLVASAVTISGPGFDDGGSDDAELRQFRDGARSLGASASSADLRSSVTFARDGCADEEWLWGERGEVQSLRATIDVPLGPAAWSDIVRVMNEEGFVYDDASGSVAASGGGRAWVDRAGDRLVVSAEAGCIDITRHTEAEDVLAAFVADVAQWLNTTGT